MAVGEVMPTPIMRWLKDRGGPVGRFSQALLLRVPGGLDEGDLAAALGVIAEHHDALRLKLEVDGSGDWRLEVMPAGSVAASALLRRVEIAGLDSVALRRVIAAEALDAERRLDPASGLMLQAVWFDAGADQAGRLLLTIHHLAVDGVSWRILVPDLEAAWRAIAAGDEAELAPRSTSLRRWAEHLSRQARSEALRGELAFWRAQREQPSLLLSEGSLDPQRDRLGTAGHLSVSLPVGVTQALLTRVPSAFHGGIEDVLLAGLSLAVADWCRRHMQGGRERGGSHAVLIDLEGHGREEGFGRDEGFGRAEGLGGAARDSGDLDLTRTVGWFTILYPVRRLDPGALDLGEALSGGPALTRAVKTIKEQLRAVPGKGLGYGLLRYLNGATAAELAGGPGPQLGFNYLGRSLGRLGGGHTGAGGAEGGAASGWVPAEEDIGGSGSPDGAAGTDGALGGDPAMPLAHGIEINALTVDGADGPSLQARFGYAPALFSEAAVRDLAESWLKALGALVRHVDEQPGEGGRAGGRTPSDLPLLTLSQGEIERLERSYPGLEDILPLTPLQEGLLFHALYDAQGPDLYTVQLELELKGPLDAARLAASLQSIVQRHQSLRTCFVQEGLSRPVQVVQRHVEVPWRLLDLSALDEAAQAERLREIAAQDRAERFAVEAAPLIRFALIKMGAQRHRVLLSNHHLLMDGWSAPILVREWLAAYGQDGSAAALPSVTPYRDYLAWLNRQDRAASIAAWRQALSGLEEGTHLIARRAAAGGEAVAPRQVTLKLEAGLSASLQRCAREHAVTLNTLMQAVFGVLLGKLTGRDDVVFGVTVSGRPAELAGVEQMVGLFINTLPLRMRLEPGLTLGELLTRTQAGQSALLAHQQIGLGEIQQAAALSDLFDTLLVFENYPVDRAGLAEAADGLRLGAVEGRDATHYPLTLLVQPGEHLQLRLDYRPDLIGEDEAETLAERLIRLLTRPPPLTAQREARRAADAGRGRARHHRARVERHQASGACRDPARAVRAAGGPHPGRHRGHIRRAHAQLRGTGRPRQPPRQPPPRIGRGT